MCVTCHSQTKSTFQVSKWGKFKLWRPITRRTPNTLHSVKTPLHTKCCIPFELLLPPKLLHSSFCSYNYKHALVFFKVFDDSLFSLSSWESCGVLFWMESPLLFLKGPILHVRHQNGVCPATHLTWTTSSQKGGSKRQKKISRALFWPPLCFYRRCGFTFYRVITLYLNTQTSQPAVFGCLVVLCTIFWVEPVFSRYFSSLFCFRRILPPLWCRSSRPDRKLSQWIIPVSSELCKTKACFFFVLLSRRLKPHNLILLLQSCRYWTRPQPRVPAGNPWSESRPHSW